LQHTLILTNLNDTQGIAKTINITFHNLPLKSSRKRKNCNPLYRCLLACAHCLRNPHVYKWKSPKAL